jgi:hypothetical protein
MKNTEQSSNIMIRNIPKEANENFKEFARLKGTTAQKAILKYIESCGKQTDRDIMSNMAISLCINNPDMIDGFITEKEPFHRILADAQRAINRRLFVVCNPSYIFYRYVSELGKKDISEKD